MEEVELDEVEGSATSDGVLQVTTSKSVNGEKIERTVSWACGQNLDEAVEKFGEELVFDFFIRSGKIKLQAQVRDRIEAGDSDEVIQTTFAEWDPSVNRSPQRDPAAQVLTGFSKLDAQARLDMLEKLRAEIEAAQ